MTLHFMDAFVVEGDPEEVAKYTFIVLYAMKAQHDKEETDKVKKELDLSNLFKNMSIEDLMKRERDEGE